MAYFKRAIVYKKRFISGINMGKTLDARLRYPDQMICDPMFQMLHSAEKEKCIMTDMTNDTGSYVVEDVKLVEINE